MSNKYTEINVLSREVLKQASNAVSNDIIKNESSHWAYILEEVKTCFNTILK